MTDTAAEGDQSRLFLYRIEYNRKYPKQPQKRPKFARKGHRAIKYPIKEKSPQRAAQTAKAGYYMITVYLHNKCIKCNKCRQINVINTGY